MIRQVIAVLFVGSTFLGISQEKTFSGFVRDSITEEVIPFATIYLPKFELVTQSNESGFFTASINTSDTILTIIVYATNYKVEKSQVKPNEKQSVILRLSKIGVQEIEEVIIVAEGQKSTDAGVIDIPISVLKKMPMLGGEADIIKAFQLMPGVQGGKEGTSGLYVRGGSPDQNLFLLDNIPLYYVNHIGGFVSTFDPNAINSVRLYKSGFPARYDGRLSSVIDLRMKKGNAKKITGQVAVGVVSTKLQIEGPIGKDSSLTFLFSARRFNIDIFTRILARINSDGEAAVGYTFYDLNGKLTKKFKHGGELSFSFYNGRDRIFTNASRKASAEYGAYKYRSNIKWGNILGSVNYIKALSDKTFFMSTLGSTNFKYSSTIDSKYAIDGSNDLTNNSSLEFLSGVNDFILKNLFETTISRNYTLRYGANLSYQIFTPGRISYSGSEIHDSVIGILKPQAFNTSLFLENEINLLKKLKLNIGVNASGNFLKDTNFLSIQPRATLNWSVSKKMAVLASYSIMNQNIHYISNSGLGLPSDLWIPASRTLRPEVSNQYSVGVKFANITRKLKLNISIEGFYKDFKNLLEFREGVSLLSAEGIDKKIIGGGKGNIMGIEFLCQKSIGKFTGWVSYTLSKNTRQFNQINNGEAFPYRFDRRHDVSVVVNVKLKPTIFLVTTWVYSTGNAITLAQGKYNSIDFDDPGTSSGENGFELPLAQVYSSKNGYQLPAYHKLDIGCSFIKEKKKGIRTWNVSIYNVYNHQNPFFLYFKENEQGQNTLNQLSIFPIIPSVSYSFDF